MISERAGAEVAQFYEKSVLLECKTLHDTLTDLITTYYVLKGKQ